MTNKLFLVILTSLLLAACGTFEVSIDQVPTPIFDTLTMTAQPGPVATIPPAAVIPSSVVMETGPAILTLDMLANAEYYSDALQAVFQLEDGIHYLPHLPEESQSAFYISLTNRMAYGDINADGIQDAAVILESQRGGSGHFIELAAVLNQNGAPRNVSSTYLGDRVAVQAVEVRDGQVFVNLLTHSPTDPAMGPSVQTTWVYQLSGTDLVKLTPETELAATPAPVFLPTTNPCPAAWFFAFDVENLGLLGGFCPTPIQSVAALGQDFVGGRAYRMASNGTATTGTIYVIYNTGDWVSFVDTWDASQPSSDPGIIPPTGLYQPVDGIGKVWREYPDVRARLGWAYEPQKEFQGRYQNYAAASDLLAEYVDFIFIDHGKWGLVLVLNPADMGPNTWSVAGKY